MNAPDTHKLGFLYVVDLVTRRWIATACKAEQPPGSAALNGAFVAGVNRVTALLPGPMTETIKNAPHGQRVRTRHPRIAYNPLVHTASAPWFLANLAAVLALL